MESQKARQIFEAIKNDDVKSFESLITSNSDLNLCFGRFPLLSVCYLFDSYIIINRYEKILLTRTTFDVNDEFFEIYSRFKKYAKKSLRLFLDGQIVYPILMLAVVDDREKIAKDYKYLYKNDEILAKLDKIYKITNLETIGANKDKFFVSRKKKTKFQNTIIKFIVIFLCFAIILPSTNIVFVSSIISIKNNYDNYDFSAKEKWISKQFDLSEEHPQHVNDSKSFVNAVSLGLEYIILDEDINLNTQFKNFSGTIFGNGKNIYINDNQQNYIFEDFSGTLIDVNFILQSTNLILSKSYAFLAKNLTGRIEKCTITGNLNIEIISDNEVSFSVFVLQNDGEIINSQSDVSLKCSNKTTNNAFLTTFAIQNNGVIDSCSTSKKTYQTTTIDVTGFVIENTGTISNCTNNLSITQESSEQWHPNTAGIAIDNSGTISNVKNNGKIQSISTNSNTAIEDTESATFVLYAGGIVVNNVGNIESCENTGDILGSSVIANNYVAGITCRNLFSYTSNSFYYSITNKGYVNQCNNTGNLKSISTGESLESVTNYIGGIASNNYTIIESSNNTGEIEAYSNSTQIYAGGIVGGSFYSSNFSSGLSIYITKCVSKSNITAIVETEKYLAVGGVVGFGENVMLTDSGFVGEITINSNNIYAGGVVGYLVSNISYYGQAGSSVTSCYSGLTLVDNTPQIVDNNNGFEENEYETSNIKTKLVSNIVGLIISNSSTLYFWGNKCVESTIPVMQYMFKNSITIQEVDIEGSNTTVYQTLEEMLNSLTLTEE